MSSDAAAGLCAFAVSFLLEDAGALAVGETGFATGADVGVGVAAPAVGGAGCGVDTGGCIDCAAGGDVAEAMF